MTIHELIQLLAAHPPDMRVVVDGYEDGFDDLESHLIRVREIRLDAGEAWWEGRHRESWDDRREGSAVVKALALHRPMKVE